MSEMAEANCTENFFEPMTSQAKQSSRAVADPELERTK